MVVATGMRLSPVALVFLIAIPVLASIVGSLAVANRYLRPTGEGIAYLKDDLAILTTPKADAAPTQGSP